MDNNIEDRKREHLETVLNKDVSAKGITTGFEDFSFEHVALPEIDFNTVDTSISFLGRELASPFLISSMTGGAQISLEINLRLAEAAQSMGIAMGIGSQRAAIDDPNLADTFRVRKAAPDILLFANLGAVQLNYGYGLEQVRRAVELIEADALFLHLNPLQEVIQTDGNRNWSGLLDKIGSVVKALDVPVVIKEVGNGISPDVACRLVDTGIAGIDVAGAGGTSWSEVEAFRQEDPLTRDIAHSFSGWGIPTARALLDVRAAVPNLTLFASGGIRNGIDAAKGIRLGATLVGMAAPVLASAVVTVEEVRDVIRRYDEELRIAMFCTGSPNLAALRTARLLRVQDGGQV
ncbi:MAG: type 2 isopentenyl-diphosphate Delta-isomerase [Pseudomonadota bacterium]|nr:type 2 isopentenyl-diphosphate Delta-isomerase [Pseudomonadota bacterium]